MNYTYKLKWDFIPKLIAIGGVTHKLIYTQTLEFCQCGTNFTFIFQHAPSRIGYQQHPTCAHIFLIKWAPHSNTI